MNVENEIVDWLGKQPVWQQESVVRILTKQTLDESDFQQMTEMCKSVDSPGAKQGRSFPGISNNPATEQQLLQILSVSDVCGIDNLNPRNPVNFGESNLVAIYGNNGSGKSGYVR